MQPPLSEALPIDPRTLSGYEVRMLRVMPAFAHQACTKQVLNELVAVTTVRSFSRFPMRFLTHGLVHRSKDGNGKAIPYKYWLSDLGALTLQALEQCGIDPDDHDQLLDPRNDKRGPVTFRETMASFGLSNLQQLHALTLDERRAFEREWTANMYAACAAAGEPIPPDPPTQLRH